MRFWSLAASLTIAASACTPAPEDGQPDKLLGNPVVEARAALASGDSTLLAIFDARLEFPGTGSEFTDATCVSLKIAGPGVFAFA